MSGPPHSRVGAADEQGAVRWHEPVVIRRAWLVGPVPDVEVEPAEQLSDRLGRDRDLDRELVRQNASFAVQSTGVLWTWHVGHRIPPCPRISPGVNSFRSAATFVGRRFDRYLCLIPLVAHGVAVREALNARAASV